MAWGYWSATTVSDRGRSPRRNQNGHSSSSGGEGSARSGTSHYERAPAHSTASSGGRGGEEDRAPAGQTYSNGGSGGSSSSSNSCTAGGPGSGSGSGSQSHHHNHQQQQSQQPPQQQQQQHASHSNNNHRDEFDIEPNLSRRPSLDLSLSGQPAVTACAAHGSRHVASTRMVMDQASVVSGGGGGSTCGTLSAGNTLTRMGSRHQAVSAVEYAAVPVPAPHHMMAHYHHHHHHQYQPLQQPQLQQSQQPIIIQQQPQMHQHLPTHPHQLVHGGLMGGGVGAASGMVGIGPPGGMMAGGPPTYVEYHQPQLSFSDDDSSEDPGYATVFPNVPQQPGMPCQGEDRSIYRRGARRWRKLYRVNGHIFQAKRFNRRAFCAYCHDRIWGLGRQGFKCVHCKLLVHKKCHKLVHVACSNDHHDPICMVGSGAVLPSTGDNQNGDGGQTVSAADARGDLLGEDTRGYVVLGGSASGAAETGDSVPVEDPSKSGEDMLELGSQRQYSLNDFELIRVIGRGSYAKVLMVELKKTKRIYAMKVIKKALVTDDEDIDWVQTEKHVFETASNHPFLVGLHSCFQTPSRLFFVIEFVRGGDLMFHMQRQRRLPEEHARFYAAEISLALNFLHCKGIIYRDLKLDNVLLDHEGHIKLTDYGMCKEGIRPGDTTSTFCGTPNYIAPEILRGEDYGFSVDWWALGVLLYEMLAGRSPFDIAGASENPDQNTEDYLFQVILEKTIRIPRSLSVKAANVLKGFLNKNPVERLGCHSADSFSEITCHQFFRSIDWELLEQKQVAPPYKPRLDSERDLANFPPEFTDEPVHLTPDDVRVIEKIDQSEFEGFEYVNPLLMSLEDCV